MHSLQEQNSCVLAPLPFSSSSGGVARGNGRIHILRPVVAGFGVEGDRWTPCLCPLGSPAWEGTLGNPVLLVAVVAGGGVATAGDGT